MEDLKQHILGLGASLVGFSDLRGLLPEELSGYQTGISIAVCLDRKIIDNIKDGPTEEYRALYRRTNSKLDRIAIATKRMIENEGYSALAVPASRRIRPDVLRGLIPHKTAATRAGLGWIGKCALLVTEEYGPRVRLVTVLTDMPLSAGQAVTESRCGSCNVCELHCPGKAVKGVNWDPAKSREDIFDADACERQIARFEAERGIYICGICVSRCPYGNSRHR